MPDTSITLDNARYVFTAGPDTLKKISGNPLYGDNNCHVNIIDDKICLGLSITEFDNYFPNILDEENVSRVYVYDTPLKMRLEADIEIIKSFELKKVQQALIDEGTMYFQMKTTVQPNRDNLPKVSDKEHTIIAELLKNNDGLCIGEIHKSLASKKFLIDNMAELKKQGVTTLFLEHLFSDTQTSLLNEYLDPLCTEMPLLLSLHLDHLDKGHGLRNIVDDNPYSFKGLIMSAKKHGMRIIPIDTSISYERDKNQIDSQDEHTPRCVMMNYIAAQQFSKFKMQSPHCKYVFFVGSAHINAVTSTIPGIGEITGCPTIVVEDGTSYHYTIATKQHIAVPDIIIKLNGNELSKEAKVIQQELAESAPKTSELMQNNDTYVSTNIMDPAKSDVRKYENKPKESDFEMMSKNTFSSEKYISAKPVKNAQVPCKPPPDSDSSGEDENEKFSLKSSRFFISRKDHEQSLKKESKDNKEKPEDSESMDMGS
ncbi:membrane-targeted effector domain-containing toxin [Legionella bononiensis]|uniref:Membrane-targeted effector domain-containing toxin n=1 Tax=Legionella bononiensis TaxID=2793102 RepID=A0ABS1W7J8_9GAMM|nr:membrane-targeted effector domain-containing toxin [Legionella bononiensis]MBL7480160.1 membrane-targeted effector domain-containing toxin [Legionella bononiensis]MBL7525325.1 membrane-targeted effector domain-containing toxin [Legionella bononiensis]MBL7561509.1 membrane-targeted effector domain-containing toxin [Legionella bononiensis]